CGRGLRSFRLHLLGRGEGTEAGLQVVDDVVSFRSRERTFDVDAEVGFAANDAILGDLVDDTHADRCGAVTDRLVPPAGDALVVVRMPLVSVAAVESS